MKPIQPYGDAGVLILPWLDFSVPLYNNKKGQAGQDIVDRENSAIITYKTDGGIVTLIGDHAGQGFDIIKECKNTYPAVIQTPTYSRIYRWAAMMLGTNTGTRLITCSGQDLAYVKWADLCLYTCNDSEGRDITMVFFKLQEQVNYAIYEVEGEAEMAIDFEKYLYSTGTHYISNSGKDENSGTKGGKAGDQTGHEWELKPWYNRPWTVVLRYPDQAVALEIAKLGIAAALNNKIGYDQNQRTTYWKQLQAAGYDPSKIAVACEEDCTAGVSANVRAAGYIFGIKALQDVPICSSRNMRAEFTKAGFIALTASKYLTSGNYLLPGDILLYESHHAATNITLGKNVKEQWNPQEHPDAPVEPDVPVEVLPPYVEATGSVNVRKGPSTVFESMGILRAGEKAHYYGYAYPDNGWLLIDFNGATGWVSNKYSKVVL